MLQKPLSKFLLLISHIGANPNDDDDLRLQKMLFVSSVLLGAIPPAALIGLLYIVFREPLAGASLLTFSVASLVIIALFGQVRQHYDRFLSFELLLVLLGPFICMFMLGGFVKLGSIILWSLLCPLGAMVMSKRARPLLWFLAYLSLLAFSAFLQPYLRPTNNLSPEATLVFSVMNTGGFSIVAFVLFFYFVNQKNLFQEKSENLLLNILPKEIAAILKNENRIIADRFDTASVLFADIVNFTPISAKMTPTELVELLDEVFSYCDTLVEKHGLEKIKTIGDCYMVAAGVPSPRLDHAHVLTSFALEIRNYVSQHDFQGKRLTFRIGINSGPVVAGVIGRKKFTYDLWGDAVNTASRMESHGAGGFIQITEATYELIKSDFICESCGMVNVKGKGEMNVWYVLEKKA